MPHKMLKMYAFIVIAPDGDESLPSFLDENTHVHLPLCGTDRARIESLRGVADIISYQTGHTLRLVQFTHREEMEVITPEGAAARLAKRSREAKKQ